MNKRETLIYTIGKLDGKIDGKIEMTNYDGAAYICLSETFGEKYKKYDLSVTKTSEGGIRYVLWKNLGQCFDKSMPSKVIMECTVDMPKERVYDLLLTGLAIDKKYNL